MKNVYIPAPEVEYPTVRRKIRSGAVADWLRSFGLEHYEQNLIDNGYDDLDFLGTDVLDRAGLVEHLGIAEADCDKLMGKISVNQHVKGEIYSFVDSKYYWLYQKRYLNVNTKSCD